MSFCLRAIIVRTAALASILMLWGGAPVMAASPNLSMAAAEDARSVIEAELSKFDGSAGPSDRLKNAVASLRSHLDILRVRASEHGLAPPDLSRIRQLCDKIKGFGGETADLETQIKKLETEAKEFEAAERRWTQNLKRARGKDMLRLGVEIATMAITNAAASAGVLIAQVTDQALNYATPTGKASNDPFIRNNLPAITQTAQREFQKSFGYPYDPKNPRRKSDHAGYIVSSQRSAPILAKQRLGETNQNIAILTAEVTKRQAQQQNAAAYEPLCDKLRNPPTWVKQTPPKPKTKTVKKPKPKPKPVKTPPPVKTANCKKGGTGKLVPYVIDLSQGAAAAAVTKAGLAGVNVTGTKGSYYVAPGAVITQYPYVGDCVDPATLVAIEISSGAPEMQELIVEPAEAQIEIGETVEFSARMNYSDGSHNYLTYGSTWTPGPDHKYTGQRAGTYTVIAAFQGLMGQATVTVGERRIPRVTIPEGVRGQPATPADYVWNAFCSPRSGEVSYGKDYNATRHKIMGGPFIGPRTAKKWIDTNCPSWRCSTTGQCAAQAAAAPGTGGWSALCTRSTGAITLGKKPDPTRHTVMAGPFLGEPNARNWVASNCPSWRCSSTGQCATQAAAAPGTEGWSALCTRSTGAITLGKKPDPTRHTVMAGPFLGEPNVRNWVASNCPTWRCTSNGQCDATPRGTAAATPPGGDVGGAQCDALRSSMDSSLNDASGHYNAGNLSGAMSVLLAARGQSESQGGVGDCGGDQRIADAISKIDRIRGVLDGIGAAITACNTAKMASYKRQISSLAAPHPLIAAKLVAIDKAKTRCEIEQANADCENKYGSGYRAGKPADDGSYYCIPDKTAANAKCRELNGAGWYAGTVRSDSTYDCHPGKSARNADCQRQFGKGWYAGKVRADGSYNCHMGKSARTASCREQYGRGWYAGKVRRDGSFLCHGPSQPSGPSDADVAGAIGDIITGIIESQGSGRGSGGGSRRNCHRRRDGTIHCGSN